MIYIESERILLKDYTKEDFNDYYRLKSDPFVMYYLDDIRLNSLDEAIIDFNNILNDLNSPNRKYYYLKIEDKINHNLIGSIGYDLINDKEGISHLGYFSFKEYWHKGYMSEALNKLLEFAFLDNNIKVINTGCLKENIASERLMINSGFIKVKDNIKVLHDNKLKERVEYQLTKEKWLNDNQRIINAKAYDAISDDWSNYRLSNPINKCIKDFINYLPKNANILDIGCGSGYPIDYFLANEGFNIIGIDISKKMIEKANDLNLKNTRFINIDFLDFKDKTKFDAIIAFDSLWHIEESKQAFIYNKISNLLKDNGYFIFTHGKTKGTIKGSMFKQNFIYSALSLDELIIILKDNNLKIISLIEDYKEETSGDRELLVISQKENLG